MEFSSRLKRRYVTSVSLNYQPVFADPPHTIDAATGASDKPGVPLSLNVVFQKRLYMFSVAQ
jgi:hypothetical protein